MFRLPKFTVSINLKPLIQRKVGMFLAEAAGISAVLTSVAHYCWPAALGLAGAVVIAAVERNS